MLALIKDEIFKCSIFLENLIILQNLVCGEINRLFGKLPKFHNLIEYFIKNYNSMEYIEDEMEDIDNKELMIIKQNKFFKKIVTYSIKRLIEEKPKYKQIIEEFPKISAPEQLEKLMEKISKTFLKLSKSFLEYSAKQTEKTAQCILKNFVSGNSYNRDLFHFININTDNIVEQQWDAKTIRDKKKAY